MSRARAAKPAAPLDRALALLDLERAGERRDTSGGYLDLLGDDAPASTGLAQTLMLTGIVPRIYERWWRPLGARLATGLVGPGTAGERRRALELLELDPGDTVLDVACGPGNFTRGFADAVGKKGLAVGIDASRTMLARAVEDTPPGAAAYVRGDALALPFGDESFDAVSCFAALYLFADASVALDEMRRVLRPGGRIAILTSARSPSWPARTVEGAFSAVSGVRLFERDQITGALAGLDFADVRQELHGLAQLVGGRRAA